MTTVVHQDARAHVRLADLGLTYKIICDAILAGELARNSCTANDPPSTPGYLAWARTTRRLREETRPLGWKSSEAAQLSTTVDPTGCIAIAVATGDQATGNPYVDPKTKYPKGPAMAAAVARNNIQVEMFEPAAADEEPVPSHALTWLLLLARNGSEILCELSLPGDIGTDERVESWSERIILGPIPFEPTPRFDALEDAADFDVDVKRRKSS